VAHLERAARGFSHDRKGLGGEIVDGCASARRLRNSTVFAPSASSLNACKAVSKVAALRTVAS
jgi:hypothetical protein